MDAELADARAGAVAVRLESAAERRVDAAVHLVGVAAGIAGCIALAVVASPGAEDGALLCLAVYGAGLLTMLGCSAAYNLRDHGPQRRLWRRLDHAAIFVMIAGTYTPFAVLAIDGEWGRWLLTFVWTGAATGAALKLIYPDWHEALSIGAYLLLGWSILVAIDRVIAAVSLLTLLLLVGGAVLYSTGVLFYRWTRLPYHRAIWHGFVLAAAACHYVAILDMAVG